MELTYAVEHVGYSFQLWLLGMAASALVSAMECPAAMLVYIRNHTISIVASAHCNYKWWYLLGESRMIEIDGPWIRSLKHI